MYRDFAAERGAIQEQTGVAKAGLSVATTGNDTVNDTVKWTDDTTVNALSGVERLTRNGQNLVHHGGS